MTWKISSIQKQRRSRTDAANFHSVDSFVCFSSVRILDVMNCSCWKIAAKCRVIPRYSELASISTSGLQDTAGRYLSSCLTACWVTDKGQVLESFKKDGTLGQGSGWDILRSHGNHLQKTSLTWNKHLNCRSTPDIAANIIDY